MLFWIEVSKYLSIVWGAMRTYMPWDQDIDTITAARDSEDQSIRNIWVHPARDVGLLYLPSNMVTLLVCLRSAFEILGKQLRDFKHIPIEIPGNQNEAYTV